MLGCVVILKQCAWVCVCVCGDLETVCWDVCGVILKQGAWVCVCGDPETGY